MTVSPNIKQSGESVLGHAALCTKIGIDNKTIDVYNNALDQQEEKKTKPCILFRKTCLNSEIYVRHFQKSLQKLTQSFKALIIKGIKLVR